MTLYNIQIILVGSTLIIIKNLWLQLENDVIKSG